MKPLDEILDKFVVPSGKKKISLSGDYDPGYVPKNISREESEALLADGIRTLAEYQDRLYAQNTHALLIILQAMDAAGKDGAIKHVMTGVNPQGCQVYSFKAPSAEELDHDYMWRCFKALPERGNIGVFNRSYYEEVLVVRVHPELLERQQLPDGMKTGKIWKRRFDEINWFERYLEHNGIHVLKMFLYLSREEQKRRFLARLDQPEKNWKFSVADAREREHWDEYMTVYEDMLRHTSTDWAPWHVVPADHKWFTRLVVAALINRKLKSLKLAYPEVDDDHKAELKKAREVLESQG